MPKIIITGAARFDRVVKITLNTEPKEFPIGQEIDVHPDYAAALGDSNIEFKVLGALPGEGKGDKDGAAAAGVADAAPVTIEDLGASAPDTLVDKFPEPRESVDDSGDGTPASEIDAKVNDLTTAPAELKSAGDTPLPIAGLTPVELDSDGKPVPPAHPGDDNDRIAQSHAGETPEEKADREQREADAKPPAATKAPAKRSTAAKAPAKKAAPKKAAATK